MFAFFLIMNIPKPSAMSHGIDFLNAFISLLQGFLNALIIYLRPRYKHYVQDHPNASWTGVLRHRIRILCNHANCFHWLAWPSSRSTTRNSHEDEMANDIAVGKNLQHPHHNDVTTSGEQSDKANSSDTTTNTPNGTTTTITRTMNLPCYFF